MLSYHNFTLKVSSKVKSDTTKSLAASYGFLKVDSALETSRTNNKQDIVTVEQP